MRNCPPRGTKPHSLLILCVGAAVTPELGVTSFPLSQQSASDGKPVSPGLLICLFLRLSAGGLPGVCRRSSLWPGVSSLSLVTLVMLLLSIGSSVFPRWPSEGQCSGVRMVLRWSSFRACLQGPPGPGAGDMDTAPLDGLKSNSKPTWSCEQGSLRVGARGGGAWVVLMQSEQRPNRVTCSKNGKLREHLFCLHV